MAIKSETKTLQLTFVDGASKNVSYSISNPKADLIRATSHEQRITSHLSCIRLYTGFVAGRLVQDVPYDSPNRGFSLRAEGHSRRTADCGQRPVGPSDSHLMN